MTLRKNTRSNRYSEAEWKMRVNRAACYRLADMYGFSAIAWKHIGANIPGSEHFFINRFGRRAIS